ncbi:uncharacterized protein LOC101862669 [Aplysia californica]|uniref:Uncharacterized protein LOC101862669 n=1 Tax=Aplysia californica TaxID=6500 RepID=A0ABM1A634_APLCA|nr:uncharacterized protein LOC101862669 [Aplysia californica]
MYIPEVTVADTMATDAAGEDVMLLGPEVTSSSPSSIYIRWAWEALGPVEVQSFMVQYHRLASTYIQNSRKLPASTDTYSIQNLVADTYYKVCVTMHHNASSPPVQGCVEAATTSWHIPVSIGSSIGAILALSIIVLIVLISRCPHMVSKSRSAAPESSKYDSMSSHFPEGAYEMSDTTTHGHEDDVFSHSSDGDPEARRNMKSGHHHHHHHHHYQQSPRSLADRLCNGSRLPNGLGKHTRVHAPLGRMGRTFSLTERPNTRGQHPATKARRARLAHAHTHFHSVQSEPGTLPRRAADHASTPSRTSSLQHTNQSQSPASNGGASGTSSSGAIPTCGGCSSKPAGYKDSPRLATFRIQSNSGSDPSQLSSNTHTKQQRRAPELKSIPRTLHMSIENDTYV